jgi:uncharacterized protein YkwD
MARPTGISLALALAGGMLALLALGPAAAGAAQCKGGDRPAFRTDGRAAAKATFCLLNKERTARGLHPLQVDADQQEAASRHNRLMVRKDCFSHDCPGEKDLVGRITDTGYLPCTCTWYVGENIAWGFGSRSTPRKMVEAWMDSPPHRANILEPRFRDVGVAANRGSPGGGYRNAATFTTDFGFKD